MKHNYTATQPFTLSPETIHSIELERPTPAPSPETQDSKPTAFNPENPSWQSWGHPLKPGYYSRRSRI